MTYACGCGYEFEGDEGDPCPRCGRLSDLKQILWVRLYCRCGHVAIRKENQVAAAVCPSCNGALVPREGEAPFAELPTPPPSEEMTLVEGACLRTRDWESEVMLRAVGWTAILRGGGMIGGSVLAAAWLAFQAVSHLPLQSGEDFIGPGLSTLLGGFLLLEGRDLFRRSEVARRALIFASGVMLTCVGCGVASSGLGMPSLSPGSGRGADELLVGILVATYAAPDLFSLYVLLGPGRAPLLFAWRDAPLASIQTTWTTGGSARAWASIGVLFIAGVHGVFYFCAGAAPWFQAMSRGW